MDCELAREALSTLLDRELSPPNLPLAELEEHLAICGECREWAVHAERLQLTFRVEETPSVPDMRGEILRLFDSTGPARVSAQRLMTLLRSSLLVVAALQLVMVVPNLMLGHDREAPVHIAHEMGSFELAVALGLLAVAYQPAWAAGMAWFAAAAAITLLATASADLASGTTTMTDEAPHVLVVVAAVLLIVLARRQQHSPSPAKRGRWKVSPSAAGPGRQFRPRHQSGAVARLKRWHCGLQQNPADGRRAA